MIWLVRHGQSEANAGLVSHDAPVIALTPLGLAQAQALADWCPAPPQWVGISPFLRARQTAEPLLRRFPNVPASELAVQEFVYLNAAKVGGLSPEERERCSQVYWDRLDPDHCEGGNAESFADLIQRCRTFLTWAREQSPLGMVYSHAEFIRCTLLLAMYPNETDVRKLMQRYSILRYGWSIPNACIIPGRHERERWWFGGIDVGHLNPVEGS
jgi:broad specificity phosphatase PhoE